MKTNSELFEKMVTYPSTNFPGRTQEGLLTHLLRKKLEPGVERWVDEGRAMAGQIETDDGLEEKWRAARDLIGERVARAVVTHRRDAYTAEEREIGIENVNTGLQKPMKFGGGDGDSESDADEDEDEEMKDLEVAKDGTGPTLEPGVKNVQGNVRSLDEIVRFMMTGLAPEDEVQVGGIGYRR